MSKEQILRITLFVSVLAFNPAIAERLNPQITTQTQQQTSLSGSIAKLLHKRGLDEETAQERSQAFVGEEEEALNEMIEQLLQASPETSREEILTYMSQEALWGKSLSMGEYDNLIGMMTKIMGKTPNSNLRRQLKEISKQIKYV